MSRIRQHQAVYAALGGRVGGELHALQLETAVPNTENEPVTDANSRIADIVKTNDIVLFMKGTALFPQCGFSSRAIAILDRLGAKYETVDVLQDPEIRAGHQGLFGVADRPPALRKGRVRRRLRHHDGDVRERRAAAASRRGSDWA